MKNKTFVSDVVLEKNQDERFYARTLVHCLNHNGGMAPVCRDGQIDWEQTGIQGLREDYILDP